MALASRGRPGRPGSSALGIPSSSHCTYLRGFNPFILTVTTIEYTPEDATVPRGVSLSRKFLRQKPFSYVISTLPDTAPSPQASPACNFWAVSQAEPARNATTRRRFPKSAKSTANDTCRKHQKSRGCDSGQGHGSRKRQRGRNKHGSDGGVG